MLNHITIMGRLTRDPELRHTQAGTPVASFTLAVDRDYKKGPAKGGTGAGAPGASGGFTQPPQDMESQGVPARTDPGGAKDTGERPTDFIDCVAWRGTAELVARYFTKGRMAVADGRLQLRSYTDRDGNKRRAAEVVADNVYFGDSKKDGDAGTGSAYRPASGPVDVNGPDEYSGLADDDGELPF